MDLLDEIEGAITEDGVQSASFNRNINDDYHERALHQHQRSQPFHPAPSYAFTQPYHRQPEHFTYDQPPGLHLASSSSYSQGKPILLWRMTRQCER